MRDVRQEQIHRQYAAELRNAGWIVLQESDFTVDNFCTDPYFYLVVTRIARWYENPTDPPNPEALAQLIRLATLPLPDKETPTGKDET